MKCRICGNAVNNVPMEVSENLHGTKEIFSYFQCSNCECIQILQIPENAGKYYPANYYAFNSDEGNKYIEKKLDFFRKVQTDYLIYGKHKFLGKLFTLAYHPPKIFTWLRNLNLAKDAHILDIGCGSGTNLKRMYQLGYRNLTGVDLFIEQDYYFSDTFKIYKKDPLEMDETDKFDCIMMHHSFEHMEFQRPILQKIKQLLKKDGKLLIRIPVHSEPLWKKYGVNAVFLDAPRHFFIHSIKSMQFLCNEVGLNIDKIDYDADELSFWASEEYIKGIASSDENSCAKSRKTSTFSKKEIKEFKRDIQKLNEESRSDAAAFYISLPPLN